MQTMKILACRTLEEEIRTVLPRNVDCEFLEYALHNTPDELHRQLQKRIDENQGYERLLFGYGLCSNGLADLKTEQQIMVIPRVHDCISLLLGSRRQYDMEFENYPATYYLSKGWIKQKGDPLSGFYKYCEKYGERNARWLISEEYKHYQRVAFIHTVGSSDEDIQYSRAVAEFLHITFSEIDGSMRLLERLVKGDWNEEFLIVPPGESVSLYNFM